MVIEHSRFQLEASKLGRDVMFQVTVFEREERRRKKLFAETQCSDPFHLVIQFIIREAPDFESLLARFVAQLEHRGFAPMRMRMRLGVGSSRLIGTAALGCASENHLLRRIPRVLSSHPQVLVRVPVSASVYS